MKRIIIVFLLCALLLACQPTPEEEFVVNKGDGTFEERIQVTAAPQEATETVPDTTRQPDAPAIVDEAIPESWVDGFETAGMQVPIEAQIRTNGHPCPICKVKRHAIQTDEMQRIASSMLPPVNAVWNSTSHSKQEYEQALASLSAQGLTQLAKDTFQEMNENSFPDEDWKPASEVMIDSGVREVSFRCENGQIASVQCYGNSLCIDAHRHAIAYSADLLAIDGYYENQGPVHIEPKISREKAEETLYAFLEQNGFSGYLVCNADKASYFDNLGMTEYSQGWNFRLVNAGVYIPIDLEKGGLGSIFRLENGDAYSSPWHPESMVAYVSEYGVESFGWYDPTETVEVINPDVQLLGFSEMQKRIKNMLCAGLSWMGDLKAPYADTPVIKELILTQTLVPVKNERDAAYLMPTWVVVSDWYGPNGVCSYRDYCCFNAVDGSPILLEAQDD